MSESERPAEPEKPALDRKKLRQLLQQTRITHEEMGKKLGFKDKTAKSAVTKILRGEQKLKGGEAAIICTVLGITMADLYPGLDRTCQITPPLRTGTNQERSKVTRIDSSAKAMRLLVEAEMQYLDLDDLNAAMSLVVQVETSHPYHRDDRAQAEAELLHAHLDFDSGRLSEGRDRANRVVKRSRQLGEPLLEASATNSVGAFHDAFGEWKKALACFRRAEQTFDAAGCDLEVGRTLLNRAVAEFFLKGPAVANRTCQQGLEMLKDTASCDVAYGWLNLGLFALASGKLLEARRWFDGCREWLRSTGERWLEVNLRQAEANWLCLTGDAVTAAQELRELLDQCLVAHDPWWEIDVRINLAVALANADTAATDDEVATNLTWAKQRSDELPYPLGIQLAGFLLERHCGNNKFRQEGEIRTSRPFKRIVESRAFMPSYSLVLRAKLLRSPRPVKLASARHAQKSAQGD